MNIFKGKMSDVTLNIKMLNKECTWNGQGKIPWSIWFADTSFSNGVCSKYKEDGKDSRSPFTIRGRVSHSNIIKNAPKIM